MRIVKAFPPNYWHLRKQFHLEGRVGILYAWGDIIYNPSNVAVPLELIEHEQVHGVRQTALGIEQWWAQYMDDAVFRLAEEVLAHEVEYRVFARGHERIVDRAHYLDLMAKRLSGKLYGCLLSYDQAKEMIVRPDATA